MNIKVDKSRKGIFYLDNYFLMNNSNLAKRIFSACIVVRAEHHFFDDKFQYKAYSQLFDPISPGQHVPTYEFLFDGENNLTVKRKENYET